MLQYAIFPRAYLRNLCAIISLPEGGFRLKKEPAAFKVARHVAPRHKPPVGHRVKSHRISNQRSKSGPHETSFARSLNAVYRITTSDESQLQVLAGLPER